MGKNTGDNSPRVGQKALKISAQCKDVKNNILHWIEISLWNRKCSKNQDNFNQNKHGKVDSHQFDVHPSVIPLVFNFVFKRTVHSLIKFTFVPLPNINHDKSNNSTPQMGQMCNVVSRVVDERVVNSNPYHDGYKVFSLNWDRRKEQHQTRIREEESKPNQYSVNSSRSTYHWCRDSCHIILYKSLCVWNKSKCTNRTRAV